MSTKKGYCTKHSLFHGKRYTSCQVSGKLPKLNVILPKTVTVKKTHETYELEYDGYKIFVDLNNDTITLKNLCECKEFVFDTVRNPVTKKRWQAIAQLIIEATALI